MIVLGIDPGTAIVGYGVIEFENNKFKVLDYGCIFTSKDDEMPKRLNKIYDELETIIKLYKPDSIAIEELFYFKNSKTVISVGQARGVIVLCCERNNIESYGYTPLQVKMGVCGYGRADKKQIQEIVKKLLGLREIPKPDDAADALAIAIVHINSKNSRMESVKSNNKIPKIKSSKMTAQEYRKLLK
ncbi:crossover junction endodeoxyribonuclease RuvC [Haliovirga abyssi]|uniref:Crossover junction endodeoxyribonuclease RuvC n=1 Tax=Haliovirga abyssi TaxID=2996794 RepID=A0AAU9DEJ1_9FUSO|nr:crossover junction endodeoxyribonuclease RuvC [Haliovirga abyssi]BDU50603.1 crossover junction endodeoxyribonuclease RuvC [Haliovirga abyssi]